MKMDQGEPYNWARAFKGAFDETVRMPLWEFPPEAAKALIHERRIRFPGEFETEEIDPEYH